MSVCELPVPLSPREHFGREVENAPHADYHRGDGGRHDHSVDEDRVAVVERAVATGFDLDEAAEDSGLTPRVCWSIAVRLARGQRHDAPSC